MIACSTPKPDRTIQSPIRARISSRIPDTPINGKDPASAIVIDSQPVINTLVFGSTIVTDARDCDHRLRGHRAAWLDGCYRTLSRDQPGCAERNSGILPLGPECTAASPPGGYIVESTESSYDSFLMLLSQTQITSDLRTSCNYMPICEPIMPGPPPCAWPIGPPFIMWKSIASLMMINSSVSPSPSRSSTSCIRKCTYVPPHT